MKRAGGRNPTGDLLRFRNPTRNHLRLTSRKVDTKHKREINFLDLKTHTHKHTHLAMPPMAFIYTYPCQQNYANLDTVKKRYLSLWVFAKISSRYFLTDYLLSMRHTDTVCLKLTSYRKIVPSPMLIPACPTGSMGRYYSANIWIRNSSLFLCPALQAKQ